VTFFNEFKVMLYLFIPGLIAQQGVNLSFAIVRFFEYGFFEALGRTTFAVILGLVFSIVACAAATAIALLIPAVKEFRAANRA